MRPRSRSSEIAQRFADRRRREDEAPRLREVVPSLATLRLEIAESRGATSTDPKHVRLVVVESAPALFFLQCGDHACRDGGHEMTDPILRALRGGETRFELDDPCHGTIGGATCGAMMHIVVMATYSPAS
jgi:hypothetical protein